MVLFTDECVLRSMNTGTIFLCANCRSDYTSAFFLSTFERVFDVS